MSSGSGARQASIRPFSGVPHRLSDDGEIVRSSVPVREHDAGSGGGGRQDDIVMVDSQDSYDEVHQEALQRLASIIERCEKCSTMLQSYVGCIEEGPYTKALIQDLTEMCDKLVSNSSYFQSVLDRAKRGDLASQSDPLNVILDFGESFADDSEVQFREMQKHALQIVNKDYFDTSEATTKSNARKKEDDSSDLESAQLFVGKKKRRRSQKSSEGASSGRQGN